MEMKLTTQNWTHFSFMGLFNMLKLCEKIQCICVFPIITWSLVTPVHILKMSFSVGFRDECWLMIYCNFCLNCFLKMTGAKDSSENAPSNKVDRSENASDELAIVFNVWPAWIAKNDGGATPARTEQNIKSIFQFHLENLFVMVFGNKWIIT